MSYGGSTPLAKREQRLEGEVKLIAGTLVPYHEIVVGREGFRDRAFDEDNLTAPSQIRAAVNTAIGQSWVWRLADGTPATHVDSAAYWFETQRKDDAHTRMVEGGKQGGASGGLPPKPGSRPRGRPRKGQA